MIVICFTSIFNVCTLIVRDKSSRGDAKFAHFMVPIKVRRDLTLQHDFRISLWLLHNYNICNIHPGFKQITHSVAWLRADIHLTASSRLYVLIKEFHSTFQIHYVYNYTFYDEIFKSKQFCKNYSRIINLTVTWKLMLSWMTKLSLKENDLIHFLEITTLYSKHFFVPLFMNKK